jgi:hypothetical protein
MQSIFNPSNNKELITRIQSLEVNNKAQWGKMSVAQMVVHAQSPLKVAIGELQLKRSFVGFLFGSIAKRQLVSAKPFGKNLPTANEFKVHTHPDFEKEKINLIKYVEKIGKAGPSGITQDPHPFFGKMNIQQWDALMYKHLDHHLRQFGC